MTKNKKLEILHDFEKWISFYLKQDVTNKMNRHFRPIWPMCLPCYFRYDYILKAETSARKYFYAFYLIWSNFFLVAEDMNLIQSKLEVEIPYKKAHMTSSNVSSEDLSQKFYSQLNMNQLKQLYKIFYWDFILFNYTMSPYDTYVKK